MWILSEFTGLWTDEDFYPVTDTSVLLVNTSCGFQLVRGRWPTWKYNNPFLPLCHPWDQHAWSQVPNTLQKLYWTAAAVRGSMVSPGLFQSNSHPWGPSSLFPSTTTLLLQGVLNHRLSLSLAVETWKDMKGEQGIGECSIQTPPCLCPSTILTVKKNKTTYPLFVPLS